MKKHILKENYERFFEKREFGDPLPTFEDVMKKHQVNKLEEGWWENMSDAAQKAYIKKYGEAPGSAGGDEDDYDMGVEPGSRDSGPWTPEDDPDFEHGPSLTSAPGRVPDEDDYDMGVEPGSRDTGPWTPEDDPDFEHGPSLTSAPGRVPDEDDLSTSPEKDYEPWDSFADRDAEMTPDDLKKIQALGEPSGDEDDEESSGRTGNELNQETLMIDGKQYNRITEGKIDSKFIKYRVYDKISDEIDKVEPDDFNLRDFNSLKKPLIKFIQREVSKDKKIDTGDLRKAIDKSDFDDKVFGRGGIIDGWYKKSERDFPKFLKRNSNLKWKNYNASSLTYGIGKPLYKIVDSLLDGINSLVPESKYSFSEFYKRFKK